MDEVAARASLVRIESQFSPINPVSPSFTDGPAKVGCGTGFVVQKMPLTSAGHHQVWGGMADAYGVTMPPSPDGITAVLALTCAHVVSGNPWCWGSFFSLRDMRPKYPMMVVRYSQEHDVALIVALVPSVDASGITTVRLAPGMVPSGTRVTAMGYMLASHNPMVTHGTLSGFRNGYQHSAAIAPGNSGGPLFRSDSMEVIGINSSKIVSPVADNIGFANPSARCLGLMDSLMHDIASAMKNDGSPHLTSGLVHNAPTWPFQVVRNPAAAAHGGMRISQSDMPELYPVGSTVVGIGECGLTPQGTVRITDYTDPVPLEYFKTFFSGTGVSDQVHMVHNDGSRTSERLRLGHRHDPLRPPRFPYEPVLRLRVKDAYFIPNNRELSKQAPVPACSPYVTDAFVMVWCQPMGEISQTMDLPVGCALVAVNGMPALTAHTAWTLLAGAAPGSGPVTLSFSNGNTLQITDSKDVEAEVFTGVVPPQVSPSSEKSTVGFNSIHVYRRQPLVAGGGSAVCAASQALLNPYGPQ